MLVRKAILRYRTERVLKERRAKFGDYHPATFAAFQRAWLAWNYDKAFAPPLYTGTPKEIVAQQVALSRAWERATTTPGFQNRHRRRRGL